MSERWSIVAAEFGRIVDGVAPDGWDRPAPCAGWVARDVVQHLVTWVPSVLGRSGLSFHDDPDATPAQRWAAFATTISAALADPALAGAEFDAGPPGTMTLAAAVDMLAVGDVLVHSWDLAVATGQQAQLDPDLVHDMLVGLQPIDEMLRSSGHYGPKVPVPADADETTRLLAFVGRDVATWS